MEETLCVGRSGTCVGIVAWENLRQTTMEYKLHVGCGVAGMGGTQKYIKKNI
jgi:hypothetical protein